MVSGPARNPPRSVRAAILPLASATGVGTLKEAVAITTGMRKYAG